MPAFFMASKARSVGVRLACVDAVNVICGWNSGFDEAPEELKTFAVVLKLLYSVTPTHSPALARRIRGSVAYGLSFITYCSGNLLTIGLASPVMPEPRELITICLGLVALT